MSEMMSPEDWLAAKLAAGDGPIEAVKIPFGRTRLLLLAGKTDARMRDVIHTLLLRRWGAQQDRARVREDGGVSISSGFIGVTAFTRRGVLRKAMAADISIKR